MGEEYFGTPTFFSEQTAEKDLAASPTLPDTEQPVLQVLHELLNSNKSQSVSVKDLVSVGQVPNYENVQHSNISPFQCHNPSYNPFHQEFEWPHQ